MGSPLSLFMARRRRTGGVSAAEHDAGFEHEGRHGEVRALDVTVELPLTLDEETGQLRCEPEPEPPP